MSERAAKVRVETLALARALPSGSMTVQPVVDGDVLAFGTEAEAHAQLRVYLAETLGKLAPERAARYFLPAGVELATILVPLDVGAPTKARSPRPVAVTCVLVPQGAPSPGGADPAAGPGRTDRWAFVPALGASFFVGRREDLVEIAAREIARVVAARDLDGDEWRQLLPPLDIEAVPLTIEVGLARSSPSTRRWMRWTTRAQTAATSSSVGAGSGTNRAPPTPSGTNTPSGTRVWKWTLRLRTEPKRWIAVTAPGAAPTTPRARACARCQRNTARTKQVSTADRSSRSRASAGRSRHGTDRVHCR